MPIPDFQSLMLPLLQGVSDGKEHSSREVADVLAARLKLTEEDLQQVLPSGQRSVFVNRIAWANRLGSALDRGAGHGPGDSGRAPQADLRALLPGSRSAAGMRPRGAPRSIADPGWKSRPEPE